MDIEEKRQRNYDRVISACLAIIAIIISIKSCNDSVTNADFAKLLKKTDSVITDAQLQLKISNDQLDFYKRNNEFSEKGNKYRFIAALFRLGSVIGTEDYAKTTNAGAGAEGYRYFLTNRILPVIESQMDNPFLCRDDSMLKYWLNAYIYLNIIGNQGDFSNKDYYGKDYDVRAKSRIDELTHRQLNRDILSAWHEVNKAYLFCGHKMQREYSTLIFEY